MLLQIYVHDEGEYYINFDTESRLIQHYKNRMHNYFSQMVPVDVSSLKKPYGKNSVLVVKGKDCPMIRQNALKLIEIYGNLANVEPKQPQGKILAQELPSETLIQASRISYSVQTEGLIIYTSRVLRPVWGKPILNISAIFGLEQNSYLNFSSEEIYLLMKRLNEISTYIQLQYEKKISEMNQHHNDIAAYISQEQYFSEELVLVQNLKKFILKVIQFLEIVSFLQKNNFRRIFEETDQQLQ